MAQKKSESSPPPKSRNQSAAAQLAEKQQVALAEAAASRPGPPPIVVRYERGLYLPELDLWLDPHDGKPRAFISHAHSDHVARHSEVLCSETTGTLMRARFSGTEDLNYTSWPWKEPLNFADHTLRLLPAGHIFGSAMLHVTRESDGATLLYTGDFKLRQGRTAELAEPWPAQTLIMETTFGLPKYAFPPTEEVMAQLVKFARETVEDGGVPVLMGYSLGKAQEIISALAGAGLRVLLHPSVYEMTEIYRLVQDLPVCEKFAADKAQGSVLVFPPNAARHTSLRKIKNKRLAMITGWAMDSGSRFRYMADAVFCLSDHADYPDLVKLVEIVQPQRVLTLHGYAAQFAADMRRQGIEAWSLLGENQLEMSLEAVPVQHATLPAGEEKAADEGVEPRSFGILTQLAREVTENASRLEKVRLMAQWLATLTAEELTPAILFLSGRTSVDPAEEGATQTGWAIIKRALIEATGVAEAQFQTFSRSQSDAGGTAYLALNTRPKAARQSLALAEVDALFARLRAARGPVPKVAELVGVLKTVPSREGAFLVRILTGDLRMGSKEGVLVEAVAEAFKVPASEVREAYLLLGNLAEVAELARSGKLEEAGAKPLRALQVMLASPETTAKGIWKRMHTAEEEGSAGILPANEEEESGWNTRAPSTETIIWLEDKFDGIRAQLHKFGDKAELFSRDLRPLRSAFPEVLDLGRQIKDDVILDGEIIAYAEGKRLTFFDLQKRLGRRMESDLFLGPSIPVRYIIFDLLWKNGRSLLREPLRTRREELEKIALPPAFYRIEVHEGSSIAAIERLFGQAQARGNEGLIAKDADSFYTPGRRGMSWLKLKKAMSTLDVVVVAAEQGHGKRSQVLSDYTFAVRDEKTNALRVIGKAYSGLTDVEIEEMTEHFTAHTISIQGHKRLVEPNIVLEIAFDSIQESTRHDSGLSLRFPRIKAIRRDKRIADIDTLESARRLVAVE